ncbi:MAG: hypothetical protein AUK35_00950 [Zetaproteobacteria bacterium CG2_30_46_52]|nr:MAG: hypothetical protein AUK35_00950 [Zetaproteobacteria bacterium CG2_30_46_52]
MPYIDIVTTLFYSAAKANCVGVVMNKQDKQNNDVRRKLLKAMVYAPPVILGSMVATPRTAMGAIGQTKTCKMTGGAPSVMITISSGTNACCPCIPGSTKYDPVKCSESQCLKSCGTNCPPGMLATIKCKDFCKICGFTPVGCKSNCKCNGVGTGKKC